MENLILVLVVFFLLKITWDKLSSIFSKKGKKISNLKQKDKQQEAREKAIADLMGKIQKAKLDRPELIEENPRLAAHILKSWVNKDTKPKNS